MVAEGGQRADRRAAQEADQGGRPQGRGAAPGRALGVAADQEHAGQGPDPQRGRGPGADLRPAPAGRRAQPGDRAAAAAEAVLQPEALRPRAGGPLQDQPAAQAQDRPEPHGPDRGRFRRDHPLPDRPARRARLHRRHRPPGQPPHPDRGRADRQPVLRRPVAHGAAGQGADEHQLGSREDLARRPGQRPDGERGDPGVLRELAAVAVHGPDQPAGRADQQAPALGARPGRPHARARRLRGPRRALLAVRPDVPDRDAGRPEHRPDHQPLDLRPDQRPRASSRRRTAW